MSAPASWKIKSTRNETYLEAQQKAKELGLPFALKLADVPLPSKCPVLGIPVELSKPKRHPHTPTVILVDPARGFVPGNTRVVSYAAAELRGVAKPRELRAVANYLDRELKMEIAK